MKWNQNNPGTVARTVLAVIILLAAAVGLLRAVRQTLPPQESAQPELPSAPVETPTPTPTPEPTPDPDAEAKKLLAGMSVREKICQLLIVQPDSLAAVKDGTKRVSPELAKALKTYPVGGVLMSLKNMESAKQLRALTDDLQKQAALPMLICVDEEGGSIARLMQKVGTTKLDNMYAYRNKGPGVARLNARTIGEDLAAFGFNTDLAPVADVWSNPDNEVIGERAYADDPAIAAELVAAAVQGFHDSGTICCLKHFPGHGSTRTDSHEEAAYVDETLETLRKGALLPFQSGIDAGADMVMVGHLTAKQIDSVPATFSRKLVTDLLREELGFSGVVITDGLEMAAAGDASDGEKALRALDAGCDLLLDLYDIPGTVEALEQAVRDGTLTEDALDAHVLRILKMKLAYGLTPSDAA